MKVIIVLLSFVALAASCLADDTNQVLTGGWSDSVGGLRMRLIVEQKHAPTKSTAVVYLEMQNVSDVINPIEFPSGFSLDCKLTNSLGTPLRNAPCIIDGFVCDPFWIYIPYDSTLKLRVDDINANILALKDQSGLSMAVGSGYWLIPDNSTNENFLTGVFQVTPQQWPVEHIHAWQGTIQLPSVGINFHK